MIPAVGTIRRRSVSSVTETARSADADGDGAADGNADERARLRPARSGPGRQKGSVESTRGKTTRMQTTITA